MALQAVVAEDRKHVVFVGDFFGGLGGEGEGREKNEEGRSLLAGNARGAPLAWAEHRPQAGSYMGAVEGHGCDSVVKDEFLRVEQRPEEVVQDDVVLFSLGEKCLELRRLGRGGEAAQGTEVEFFDNVRRRLSVLQ